MTDRAGVVARLAALADNPGDSDDDRLRHRALVTMAVSMSGAAGAWGVFTLAAGLYAQSAIPFGYAAITAGNLLFLGRTKDFATARFIQVGVSLLLPFVFQWTFGGFVASGGVMLWALIALIGSLTFAEARWTGRWLVVFTALTLVSGVVDATVSQQFDLGLPALLETAAFVFNAVAISWIAFGLVIFLLERRDRALAQVVQVNSHLEELVGVRTEALTAALAENEALIAHATDGLVGMDGTGTLRSANPVAHELFDLPESPIGMGCHEVLPPEVVELGLRCRASGRSDSVDIEGETRVLRASASPVQSETLDLGCVILVRDVTVERQIDRMKTDFTATVSHELRTPLTSVLGFAKLIRNKLEKRVFPHVAEDPAAQKAIGQTRQNLDVILEEGERLTSLINDVLDIAKMESGRMEWKREALEPGAVVDRAVNATASLFPEERDVEVDVRKADELPSLHGDRDRLVQVMINLISNASKFTDQGRVTIAVETADDGVQFVVRDTGVGIPANKVGAVFEKFGQAHTPDESRPKGTGLGLPICRQIVEAHQGRISVESEVGTGSTFRVWLPR